MKTAECVERNWGDLAATGGASQPVVARCGWRRPGLLSAVPVLMLVLLALLAGTPAKAELQPGDQPQLSSRVATVLADPAQKQAALIAGRDRAIVCAYCHGKDGNSIKRIVPSLAAQHPAYLVDQLIAYANGSREDFIMQGMMRDFSADDVVNISAFYSSQALKPIAATGKGDVGNGKRLFLERCQACHGADGAGGQRYPRVAGQSSEYLTRALQRYRDPQGKRNDPTMSALAAALSDAEIADLSNWLETAR